MKKLTITLIVLITSALMAVADINDDLIQAASSGRGEEVKTLLSRGANPAGGNSFALRSAASRGHVEVVRLLLSDGRADPRAEDSLSLRYAAGNGYVEVVRLLLLDGRADPAALDSDALRNAAKNKRVEVLKLLLDKKIEKGILNEVVLSALDAGHLEVVEILRGAGAELDERVIIRRAFLSGDHKCVKELFEAHPELKDAYLIGLNHFGGEWTDSVRKVAEQKVAEHAGGYIVNISLEIGQDEEIMKCISGFINPGAGDSFPRDEKPFALAEMDEGRREYHEKVYQQVITMAKKLGIPYLGICAGSQHLVLNSGGYLKRGGHGGAMEVQFSAGTIPHYLLLTQEEKARALGSCDVEDLQINDAHTAHGYSGYRENLGEGVQLGAVSRGWWKSEVEAISLGADKIGTQFHPEKHYFDDYEGVNRHKQFLDSVFGIFEGYHRSMGYAKKEGVSREDAIAAMKQVNEELVEHLKSCQKPQESYFSQLLSYVGYGNKDSDKEKSSTQLWGRGLRMKVENPQVRTIKVIPGVTAADIAVTEQGGNLVLFTTDEAGELVVLEHIKGSKVMQPLRIEFADGTFMELESAEELYMTCMPGKVLVRNSL